MKKNGLFLSKQCHKVVAFLLMLVVMISALGISASADSLYNTPYDTYTYWTAPGTNWTVSSTPLYEYETTISSDSLNVISEGDIGAMGNDFSGPSDIATDSDGNIYILDTGNGRVVVVNSDYTLKAIIKPKTTSEDGMELTIAGARGIYVTEDKRIFIADTENARVLVCDTEGKVLGTLGLPDEDVIPEAFNYLPVRVGVDSEGFLYVLSEGSYYGALLYKPTKDVITDYEKDYEFTGFYGANSTTGSVLDVFTKLFQNIFVTDQEMENRETQLPYSFTDIALDNQNFVYTATGAVSQYVSNVGQLKKLSPGGTNVLKDKTTSKVSSAESKNFSDGKGSKYPLASGNYAWRVTDLTSMDVDSDGYMYGLCATYGHIFIYDQDCNLLTVFGGATALGTQEGTFYKAATIHVDDTIDPKTGEATDKIYIVDKNNNTITVFKETEYGRLLKSAQKTTNSGDYVAAKEDWNKVLSMDANQQLAYRGLAKAALVEEDYETAMEYAEIGFDPDTYASAYKYVRNDSLTVAFVWIAFALVVLIGAIVFYRIWAKKRNFKLITNPKLTTMFSCVVHPFEGANQIRYYNKGSAKLASVVLFLYMLSCIISEMYSGFMYNIFDKSSYNALFTILRSIGVVVLWSVVNWGMSTLFQGKGKMKHVYIVTCYALIPLIINNLLSTVLTNVLIPEEALVITAISVVCTALAAIMLCVGTMTVHEYGFFKFLAMTVIVVFGMLIVVFVILMVFVLVQQALSFIETVINEVTYR